MRLWTCRGHLQAPIKTIMETHLRAIHRLGTARKRVQTASREVAFLAKLASPCRIPTWNKSAVNKTSPLPRYRIPSLSSRIPNFMVPGPFGFPDVSHHSLFVSTNLFVCVVRQAARILTAFLLPSVEDVPDTGFCWPNIPSLQTSATNHVPETLEAQVFI